MFKDYQRKTTTNLGILNTYFFTTCHLLGLLCECCEKFYSIYNYVSKADPNLFLTINVKRHLLLCNNFFQR